MKEKFRRWMIGRYGMDALNKAILYLYFGVLVIGLFFRPFTVVALGLAALFLLRAFSRSIYKRQKENAAWLKLWGGARGFFQLQGRRWRERKTHRYRRCPHCRATVRLPLKKGKHTVCCPRCRHDFEVRI